MCWAEKSCEPCSRTCLAVFKNHPRSFDDEWPQEKHLQTDIVLRRILTDEVEAKPKELVAIAKAELQLELES